MALAMALHPEPMVCLHQTVYKKNNERNQQIMCGINGDTCEAAAEAEREIVVEAIEVNWPDEEDEPDQLISKNAVIELIRSLD
jgi:hypothetical protein